MHKKDGHLARPFILTESAGFTQHQLLAKKAV